MRALQFWKAVTVDRSDLLERTIDLLNASGVRWCVIGGVAVNAYTDPVITLDFDLVVAMDDLARIEELFAADYKVQRFAHSLNVSAPGSNLRVQFQTDPRYTSFPERATIRDVLGLMLPVASLEDVLTGKIWAALETGRRPTKRQKDYLDIARLVERFPHLRERVPAEILAHFLT